MNPARFKHRIEIQEEKTVRNPVTKLNEKQLITFYKCWAEIDQRDRVTGGAPIFREFYQASVERNEILLTFNIRFKEGVTTNMRVLFNNKTYNVAQVRPDLQEKRTTSILCKEVV